jgi:hypothetical protein
MPHTPSPRPHLLRYVASRGIPLLCIQRAYEDDGHENTSGRAPTRGAHQLFHSDRTLWARRSTNAVSHVTMITRSRVISRAIALTFIMAACGPALNEVRIESGTTPLQPIFIITDTTGHGPPGTIYGLSVVQCGSDTAAWQIAANGSGGAPSRLVYGEAPPGYIVKTGPAPLRTGCYDIFITDGRRSRFRVDAAGRVTVDGRPIEPRRDTTTR